MSSLAVSSALLKSLVFILLLYTETILGNVINSAFWHREYEVHYPETECVTSCDDRPDGDYQSCDSCDVFVTCTNGRLEDNRPCTVEEGGVVWDDYTKRCEWFSSTCPLKKDDDELDTRCVRDCAVLPDGYYPSCTGCENYVTCSNGMTYATRTCPANLVWDHALQRCEWVTTTCEDVQGLYTGKTFSYVPKEVRYLVKPISPWLKGAGWLKPNDSIAVVQWERK